MANGVGNWGNCYVASEALYHLLGGKNAGWTPVVMKIPGSRIRHWFLRHNSGLILDATKDQFPAVKLDYTRGRGTGFLTKTPSKRAVQLMMKILWQ